MPTGMSLEQFLPLHVHRTGQNLFAMFHHYGGNR